MHKLITTTTNNLEGWTIKEYLQPISSNIVIGANIFSDISATFTDFFGGRSDGYEKKLQQIYDQAIQKLQTKAKSQNANAIIGLKIDIDEISGKGNQMFMITAYGTPVLAARNSQEYSSRGGSIETTVDGSIVASKVKAKRIIAKCQELNRIDGDVITFILENPFPEFIDTMLSYLRRSSENIIVPGDSQLAAANVSRYFSNLEVSLATDTLYNEFHSHRDSVKYLPYVRDVIKENRLIDYSQIERLIKSGDIVKGKLGISILTTDKVAYSTTETSELESLKTIISETFKPLGAVSSKKGFLSSEKEVWVCQCTRSNGMQDVHCNSCGHDIYGFKADEVKPKDIVSLLEDRQMFIN